HTASEAPQRLAREQQAHPEEWSLPGFARSTQWRAFAGRNWVLHLATFPPASGGSRTDNAGLSLSSCAQAPALTCPHTILFCHWALMGEEEDEPPVASAWAAR